MEKRHRIHPVIRQFARELRQPLTPAETTLWQVLRNRNLSFKFRRQHEIEFFIIDFYCAEVKLCIEIDGESHLIKEQQEYDAVRTEYLESLGRTVIRFTNQDVQYNINAVVQEILDMCDELMSEKIRSGLSPHPTLSPLGRGDSEQS
jgi:5-methyltetrahydrofolate--homocysteine methyltransferase